MHNRRVLGMLLMAAIIFTACFTTLQGETVNAVQQNVAQGKTASQSSTYSNAVASRAVDGSTNGNGEATVSHTQSNAQAWWMVDLGANYSIGDIKVWNRTDCCQDRLSNYDIKVLNSSQTEVWSNHKTSYPNPSTTVNAGGVTGRYVKIQLTGTNFLNLAEVQVYGEMVISGANLAQGKTATQSSTYSNAVASRAVDGSTNGNGEATVSHTQSNAQAWWMVDLGANYSIGDIKVWNRTDCCQDRLSNYDIKVLNSGQTEVWSNHKTSYPNPSTTVNAGGVTGRYVKIQLTGTNFLNLAEVQVYEYGNPPSGTAVFGVYVGNNTADLTAYENWLGKQVGTVQVHDGYASWSDWDLGWDIYNYAGVDRNKNWAIPMFPQGGNYTDGAAGNYNSHYLKAAQDISNSTTDPIIYIRPGYEWNGGWFPWGITSESQCADYIATWRHLVNTFRSVSDRFRFDWNASLRTIHFPYESAYPGDDYVDYIGFDIYDDNYFNPEPDPVQRWERDLTFNGYGLNWFADFAAAHNKQIAIAEWGTGGRNTGDNPYFIEKMHEWINTNNVAYHNYWDSDADYTGMLRDGAPTNASAKFKELFGTP